MKITLKRVLAGVGLLLLLIITGLVIYNAILTRKYREPVANEDLTPENSDKIAFVVKLKAISGSQIWPGFDTANIPLVLYNDRYEFLTGAVHGSSGWEGEQLNVEGFDRYFRRSAENPQAFAVKVGDAWAGSLGMRDQMNREMYNGISGELPGFISRIFPFFLISVTDDMHVSALIHEMFHAYQAGLNEEKFVLADDAYRFLDSYPYGDSIFTDSWNKEGEYLQKALYAENMDEMVMYADSFLVTRRERRESSHLTEEQILAEDQLEWLEGLAKYAESASYISASRNGDGPYRFKQENAYWERERNQRLPRLGNSGGDNRFYHSGAAQAFLLDQLSPGWKNVAFRDSVYLSELLIAATGTS